MYYGPAWSRLAGINGLKGGHSQSDLCSLYRGTSDRGWILRGGLINRRPSMDLRHHVVTIKPKRAEQIWRPIRIHDV